MLRRVQRLPGMPSSNVLLESLTGELDDFGVESYLGSPSAPQGPGPDLHSQVYRPPPMSPCNLRSPPAVCAFTTVPSSCVSLNRACNVSTPSGCTR